MFCQGGGLATVGLHLIKLPSNHVSTTFSISVICTLVGKNYVVNTIVSKNNCTWHLLLFDFDQHNLDG
ncbi:hypothetical protein ANCDUO_22990 [Ancylostoma duodenale]|uniref:Uncharacterized protein n=1 Tax=Ancylostoma duodenale TaxID=51022 RepID=A0A0C2FEH0_9BILA|nr:hypothetical protein ANCDUO_22990 [Ancylostoma duodenale]